MQYLNHALMAADVLFNRRLQHGKRVSHAANNSCSIMRENTRLVTKRTILMEGCHGVKKNAQCCNCCKSSAGMSKRMQVLPPAAHLCDMSSLCEA
jgi:hypothetical protein